MNFVLPDVALKLAPPAALPGLALPLDTLPLLIISGYGIPLSTFVFVILGLSTLVPLFGLPALGLLSILRLFTFFLLSACGWRRKFYCMLFN